MSKLQITIGNKNYSSWSLRGWLALKECDVAFTEHLIPLDRNESKSSLAEHSPSGLVPVLRDGSLVIWDSLAIGEYLSERFPAAGLWPQDQVARAMARSVACEMHGGFPALRKHMPMDMRAKISGRDYGAEVVKDVARVTEIWRQCRDRHASRGDFLFGPFSLADVAFAPVVSRFITYDVVLDPVSAAYRDAVWNRPNMQEWATAAAAEPWTIDDP